MEEAGRLNSKWMKASVLGCLWASSEIVLGSFLHNLRVPFTGTILTGIGIMLMISVGYLWRERGLFWRSGLVCALMKTVSPSALIFGPMIAILSEAALLELSTRLLGRNWAGYILGGILAMSWNLFQQIANLIIVYGFNVVELYSNLASFAQKQFHFLSDNSWFPVLVLWLFYGAAGIFTSVTGIAIGRRAVRQPLKPENLSVKRIMSMQSEKKESSFSWSLPWLFFNVLAMILSLFLMNYSVWKVWLAGDLAILTIWGFRYHKSLRPLKKPKFWFFFILITLSTSFLFVKLQHASDGWVQGLMAGIQMNFRAAIVIVGFSTIGTELYNPVVRSYFIRSSFRQLPMALEVAFDTLPYAIAKLPSVRDIFKRPVSIVRQMVAQADFLLGKVVLQFQEKPFVIILTGGIGEGKTAFLMNLAFGMKECGIPAGGIITPGVKVDNMPAGYDLINVSTGERTLLSREMNRQYLIKVGRFSFFKEGLDLGEKALLPENIRQSKIIVMDEIGPWELEGQGWAESVNRLLLENQIPMIWVVRESLTDKVIDNWDLHRYKVFNIKEHGVDEIVRYISENLV